MKPKPKQKLITFRAFTVLVEKPEICGRRTKREAISSKKISTQLGYTCGRIVKIQLPAAEGRKK